MNFLLISGQFWNRQGRTGNNGINCPKLEQLCAVTRNRLSVLLCPILLNNVWYEFLAAFTGGKDSLNYLKVPE